MKLRVIWEDEAAAPPCSSWRESALG